MTMPSTAKAPAWLSGWCQTGNDQRCTIHYGKATCTHDCHREAEEITQDQLTELVNSLFDKADTHERDANASKEATWSRWHSGYAQACRDMLDTINKRYL